MKKLAQLLFFAAILIVVLVSVISAFTKTSISYDFKASVGFYGENSTEEPIEEPKEKSKKEPKPKLPQTGDMADSKVTPIWLLLRIYYNNF